MTSTTSSPYGIIEGHTVALECRVTAANRNSRITWAWYKTDNPSTVLHNRYLQFQIYRGKCQDRTVVQPAILQGHLKQLISILIYSVSTSYSFKLMLYVNNVNLMLYVTNKNLNYHFTFSVTLLKNMIIFLSWQLQQK